MSIGNPGRRAGHIRIGAALAILLPAGVSAAEPVTPPAIEVDPPTLESTERAASDAAARPDKGYVEQIIVTAQKREQRLIDVPISVMSFSGEELEKAQVRNMDDVQSLSPNLTMAKTTDSTAVNFFIRGIGTGANERGLEQAVGIYVDGVYRGRPASAVLDLIDLERIEVLRGPQATLFGRNNTAGAVNIVTAKPSTDFTGAADVGVGEYDARQVRFTVSGPISDALAFRVSGSSNDRSGGEIEDVFRKDLLGFDRETYRGSALWTVTDETSLRVIADYAQADDDCCVLSPYFVAAVDRASLYIGATLPGYDEGRPGENRGQPGRYIDVFDRKVALDGPTSTTLEDKGISAELNSGLLEGYNLTLVGSRRRNESTVSVDGDGTNSPVIAIHSFPRTDIDETYFEARLTRSAGESFEWLLGYNYFRQTIFDVLNVPFVLNTTLLPPGVVLPELPPLGYAETHYRAVGNAAFGELTWHATDALRFTGGLRYLDENKHIDTQGEGLAPPLSSPTGTNTIKDHALVGSASASYDLGQTRTVYVRVARGRKSGGTNLSSIGAASVEEMAFDPEKATNYEVGAKLILFGNRVSLNLAVFNQVIDDQQVQINEGLQVRTLNASKVISRGLEAELLYRPTQRFTLTSGLTWLNAEYDRFEDAPPPVNSRDASQDLTGKPTLYAPDLSLALGAEYVLPVIRERMDFIGRVNGLYKTDYYTSLANDEMFANGNSVMLGGSLELASANRTWSVQVWGKNLLDEDLFAYGVLFPLTQASTSVSVAPGRSFGATATYRF